MAQWVKNSSAVQETQETWVLYLVWEDHLEEGMATHSIILAWKIPRIESPVGYTPEGFKESVMTKWPSIMAYIKWKMVLYLSTYLPFLDLFIYLC